MLWAVQICKISISSLNTSEIHKCSFSFILFLCASLCRVSIRFFFVRHCTPQNCLFLLSWFPPVLFHTFSTTLSQLIPARLSVVFFHAALSVMTCYLFLTCSLFYIAISMISRLCLVYVGARRRPRWLGRLSLCLLKSISRVQFSPSTHTRRDSSCTQNWLAESAGAWVSNIRWKSTSSGNDEPYVR